MYQNRKPYPFKFFLIPVLTASFIACKHDKDVVDNSPAHFIAESEKRIIPAEVDLPSNQPDGNIRVATFFADGVQKYKAQAKAGSSPVTYEWVFVAPQADLFDITNAKVGKHGAGPYWTLSTVDSIYAQAFTPAKTVASPDGANIDWLLLMPKTGKIPTGVFANVSYIQRIATKGGKAPSRLPQSADETADVPYTAIYRFTKKK